MGNVVEWEAIPQGFVSSGDGLVVGVGSGREEGDRDCELGAEKEGKIEESGPGHCVFVS
jgi:hypothetical protein